MESMDRGNSATSVAFEIFQGALITWEDLFQRAAYFASGIGPDRLIGISHSDNHGKGVVTVWYWR